MSADFLNFIKKSEKWPVIDEVKIKSNFGTIYECSVCL